MVVALVLFALSQPHPGFAHNDYVREKPLVTALQNGFRYLEADAFLVEGQILVAHDLKDARPDRTLKSLYLRPLFELHREKKLAQAPIWLMIDIKANGAQTYRQLEKDLEAYQAMLCKWTDPGPGTGGVAIVLSGDRPIQEVSGQPERWVAIDGRPEDLAKNPPVGLVPWISTSYLGFKWPLDASSNRDPWKVMPDFIKTVHAQKRLVRFWAIPDKPEAWQRQLELGIDMINTDQPVEFAKWFASRKNP